MVRENKQPESKRGGGSRGTRHLTRRSVLAATGAAATTSLSGCAGGFGGGSSNVKVGFVLPFSGTYSILGDSIVNGFKLHIDEALGGEVNGSEVEYIQKDTSADPSTGVSITREFLQSEQVDFLVGPVSSAVAQAMATPVRDQGSAIWLNANAGSVNLIRESCLEYHFRTSFNNWQTGAPLAPWVYDNVADNAFISYADYAAGKDHRDAFAEEFEKAGGTIVGEVAAPLGTSDYSSFLQTIDSSGADAVYSFFAGGDAVNYIKQFHEFGLSEKMTQTGAGFLMSADTIPAQGEAAEGKYTILHYTPTKQSSRNQEFVSAYQGAYDKAPNVYACQGYDAAQAVETGVAEAGSTNADDLIPALEGATLDSPRGYFEFSPQTHDPIHDMDVRQVVKNGDAYENNVVTTLEKVKSPNWGCNLS